MTKTSPNVLSMVKLLGLNLSLRGFTRIYFPSTPWKRKKEKKLKLKLTKAQTQTKSNRWPCAIYISVLLCTKNKEHMKSRPKLHSSSSVAIEFPVMISSKQERVLYNVLFHSGSEKIIMQQNAEITPIKH